MFRLAVVVIFFIYSFIEHEVLIPLPPDGWRMGGRLSKEIINSQSNYLRNCGAGQFSFGSGLWL